LGSWGLRILKPFLHTSVQFYYTRVNLVEVEGVTIKRKSDVTVVSTSFSFLSVILLLGLVSDNFHTNFLLKQPPVSSQQVFSFTGL
jgi:hypothetical protein